MFREELSRRRGDAKDAEVNKISSYESYEIDVILLSALICVIRGPFFIHYYLQISS